MAGLNVLFEHAAGYGLFAVKEFEETGMLLPEVEASVTDLSKFNSIVHLVGFAPFKTGANALENMNAVSEGIVTEDLQLFLDTNLPSKRKKVTVGVSEPKLGAAISEALGVKCQHSGAVPEIIRGLRLHFPNMVKGFTPVASGKAQLGLGHSYSRCKVKFNVNKSDNMIIQSIALLDQLDKDINTFSMRIREWYSYHFPELVKICPNNYMYARCTQVVRNRKEMTEEVVPQLEEILMDSAKAQAVYDASKSSMGMDISPLDLINIDMFAKRVVALSEYRTSLQNYLKDKMGAVAPNLGELVGDTVAARLISHAGSLTNLAKYPASTVQILGAEKALFRALKTRGNTPKYGLLFHSTFIGRAGAKNKGRISRYLANKCSIASRIDCFSETANTVFGEKLRQQVEERLKFYETGEIPRKNADVMKEAMEESVEVQAKLDKKKKKKKKRKAESEENGDTTLDTSQLDVDEPPKKKKKRKHQDEMNGNGDSTLDLNDTEDSKSAKKKKKKKNKEMEMEIAA
ncbi:nucleolar protein 56-like [Pollicipes pollicipes]|uniref:nucleolar protein 56-like n=1 Tax=Pollicipes pollicipes TaxID=41117 RepID=UPI00188571C5|nr:nucleolar protein 56-like [Pollicipes pollicipes]XP_037091768.1 nucleolar protein 56-like [Pollicipes pollicipes]XP_037091769.1 nucleolar protein 56-like [Pollicipes pollicipes]XP_037091770.1 nucleolar protein 56-like [Pollicipes pollicipes]XP_037091771.1 nucleolar protein 56-like [Pollicipes pollicipes]